MNNDRTIAVLIGTFAAALLGAFAAIEFDRITDVLARALTPSGRAAAIQMASMMIAGGVAASATVWVAVWVAVRTATAPYEALAERLEQLAIGDLRIPLPAVGGAAGVRRLGRAVLAVRNRLLSQERTVVDLQARNDRLCSNNVEDHRMLLGMVAGQRGPFPHPPRPAVPARDDRPPLNPFAIPAEYDEDFPPDPDEAFDDRAPPAGDPAAPIVVRPRPEQGRITGPDSLTGFSLNATWEGPEGLLRRRAAAAAGKAPGARR